MIDLKKEELAAELRGSFLEFCKFFFKRLTNRDFIISTPAGRESHHITLARALTQTFREQRESYGLLINLPPGYGKSIFCSMWVAWCYAHYADCNFLYISYSSLIATKHTTFIKQIMTSRTYEYLFDVKISADSRAKDNFKTTAGGCVGAFGAMGSITGMDAGLPNLDRFSGALIIDDAHKPDEAHSDTMRSAVKRNYSETLLGRARDVNIPFLFVGQRVHEDDLAAHLLSGDDVRVWEPIVLKGLDVCGNALYPEVQNEKYLQDLRIKQPYVFASQIQQDPVDAGNALFSRDYFALVDDEPEIFFTFGTADTAETSKTYNDATVFSFWGVYKLSDMLYGLHWIDCVEIRVEPADLESEFIKFYTACQSYKVAPTFWAIEKKSTGVTLISVLKKLRGLSIREIERTKASGSKSDRFVSIQSTLSQKLVSVNKLASHKDLVIDHMCKITANNSHRFDDIADTCADAIKIVYIDKAIYYDNAIQNESKKVADYILAERNKLIKAQQIYGTQIG